MRQVAIYNRSQHDQFRVGSESFALAKNPIDGRWQLFDSALSPAGSGLTIRLRASGEAMVIDCRGVEAEVELASGRSLYRNVPIELTLPAIFDLDGTWFELRAETSNVDTLGLAPLHLGPNDRAESSVAQGPDSTTIAKWLSASGQLHRTAASSPEFFNIAARITLNSTGLDATMVVVRDDDHWKIAGSAVAQPRYGVSFEPKALDLLLDHPDVWRRPPSVPATSAWGPRELSLLSPESIVAAPICDDMGEVIAAVYGVRHGQGENRRRGIRTLEARVVELMAETVAVGMARRQQEIEAARQLVLLEQAFTPPVAEHLLRCPAALAGQTREATLLFADLRGFTAIAEYLPSAEGYELLSDAMEMLTQAIMDHGGVVVDYYGDGVCAMWNAPFDQANHADRACAAGLLMLEQLPRVSRDWQSLLPEPLQLGIGIHAGVVQVGNAGTQQRLKYGPRGSAVNIASRVQMAAKRLDVPLLATDAVRRRLSSRFVTLKVCTARLPGLEEPLELFTPFHSSDGLRLQRDMASYAAGLDAFERGDLETAESLLSELLTTGPATPAAFLAQHAAALRQGLLGRRATDQLGVAADGVIEILAK